jgi:hypothetical protein
LVSTASSKTGKVYVELVSKVVLPKEVMPIKSEITKCKLANTDLPKY